MKLLYISGTYCPAFGGAELSIHELLKGVQSKHRVDVLVVTDKKYTNGIIQKTKYDGIDLYGIEHENRIESIECILSDYSPDIIFTQLMWSNIALCYGKRNKIPTVYRVCSVPLEIDLSYNSDHSPSHMIAVSDYVKRYIEEEFGRNSTLLHPAINLNKVRANISAPFYNEFITMFNPITKKGGKIFRELCKLLPDEKFAVVPGWGHLKNQDGKFNEKYIERIVTSLGKKYVGQIPEEVDFSDLNNVTILSPNHDVAKIYERTRILCVPSQWEEAFGRVAIEAFSNGIPVLGSDVGGLREIVASGGILVKEYRNPVEWEKHLKKLKDHGVYEEVSKKGLEFVNREYHLEDIVFEFYKTLVGIYEGENV